MPGLNDLSSDELIRHNISLMRFDAKLRRQVMGQLRVMQESIVLQLSGTGTIATKQRLQGLLSQVDSIVKNGYTGINAHMLGEMQDLAGVEQLFATKTLNDLIKVDIISAGLTPQVLRAMAKDTSILGAPAAEWWGRQSANLRNRFGDQMRQGFLLGEGTGDLVRRVRGTATGARQIIEVGGKAKSVAVFSGGIMEISTREATALVRTSINSVANEVRLATYMNNTDVIQAVQAVVTLDARTSEICVAKGNRPDEWTLPDFTPVGGSTNYIGPPPWHYNCRSSLAPITKSWEELQTQGTAKKATASQKRIARKLDNNAPKATRASMDGQVPKSLGYSEWLKTQPKSVQLEVLGPGRRDLWREGKLNLTQLIDQTGRPQSLTQIAGQVQGLTNLPSGTAIRRSADFATSALFDVTLTDKQVFQIFRNKSDKLWYEARTGRRDLFLAKTRPKAIVELEKRNTIKKAPPTKTTTKIPPVEKPVIKTPPRGTPVFPKKPPPPSRVVKPGNYRTLELDETFLDEAGATWKVFKVTSRTIRAFPWSPERGRFLTGKGTSFNFVTAGRSVKQFKQISANTTEAVKKLFADNDKFGSGYKFSRGQQLAMDRGVELMGKNGFNKELADRMFNKKLNANVFNFGGSENRLIDIFGRRSGSDHLGSYWNNFSAIGIRESALTRGMQHTWVHEFGHHMDYTLFRKQRFNFGVSIKNIDTTKILSKAGKEKFIELNFAYNEMIREYKATSNFIGKKLGLRMRGGIMSERQQKANWDRISNVMRGKAQSSYSLYNEKEWFAETFTDYFGAARTSTTRATQRRVSPRTFEFYELLFSSDMELLWKELMPVGG